MNWAPSTSTRAPAAWAASASRRTGVRVPSTLDMAVTASSLAPSSCRSRSDRSSWPSSVTPSQRSSTPVSSASISQGTMLAWCSIWVSTTASPAPEVGLAPGLGHQVDGLGDVLGEDHAGGGGGADEAGQLGPGVLHEPGGLLGDGVDAPVHVGVGGLVVVVHGVQDHLGLLGGRGRVEVARWACRGPPGPAGGSPSCTALGSRVIRRPALRSPRPRGGRPAPCRRRR